MAAPSMAAATRYFQPEVTKIVVVPTIANLATGPTRAELDAGTDVSVDVAAISGFRVSSEQISTPDLGKRFVKQTPGRTNAEDSSITFYASKDGADVRDVLARDDDTHIVILDGGDVTGNPMDSFKVTVSSVGKMRDLEDAPRLEVQFSITDFSENLTVPA